MSNKPTVVKCPQCGSPVEWSDKSPFRPFCSKKCQMIDFGEWANEEKPFLAHLIFLMLKVGQKNLNLYCHYLSSAIV